MEHKDDEPFLDESKDGLMNGHQQHGDSGARDLTVAVDTDGTNNSPSSLKIAHIQHLTVEEVYIAMGTSDQGLSEAEVKKRLDIYGLNKIREPPKPSMLWRLLSNFTHLMAILLWAAGLLSIFGDSVVLGVAIWMVNILNGSFSFYQEFQADQAADALKNMLPAVARVIREGVQSQIAADQLVPGDLIVIDEGERLSADCRVVEGTDLLFDQSTFTGESLTRAKSADAIPQVPESARGDINRTSYRNLLFSGTSVVAGQGKAVVLATGMDTEFGHVAQITLDVVEDESPLQKEMREATKVISMIAVSLGVSIFAASHWMVSVSLHDSFIFAIGMIVAFIPEGLLPLVTLSLARASLRMASQGAIIKRLSAVETLGCTSAICTDKTGTLTRNEMSVANVWLGGSMMGVEGEGYSPVPFKDGKAILPDPDHEEDPEHLLELFRTCVLCNNSQLVPPSPVVVDGAPPPVWTMLGDPTEAALLAVAGKGGVNRDQEEQRAPRVGSISFSSIRKRMTTIHDVKNSESGETMRVAYMKGAPLTVVEHCSHIRWGQEIRPLSQVDQAAIEEAQERMAVQGQRVLGAAMRILPANTELAKKPNAEAIEKEFVFLGLVGMLDPPRPGVVEAIAACQHAGIRVVMLTGDQKTTAKSIAEQIGMRSHGSSGQVRAFTGAELTNMSHTDLTELLTNSIDLVFARTLPQDKMRVVACLQELGYVVAVTGDGVNDAPALKKANIGVAMGNGGTDVAKQSSEIILTDNSFSTIVLAVAEGRAVYENMKKFLTYILSSNTAEAIPFVFFIASEGRIPLALPVLVVLCIDLGTDMIPALALGADPPLGGAMEKPPRNLSETFFKPGLLFRGLVWLGLFQGVAAMFGYYYYLWHNGYNHKWTGLPDSGPAYSGAVSMAFAGVVLCQAGNVFACRSDFQSFTKTNPFNNSLIWIGIAFELVFLMFAVYVPAFNSAFHTAPVPPLDLVMMLIFTFGILIWSDIGIGLSNLLFPTAMGPAQYKAVAEAAGQIQEQQVV